MNGGEFPLSPTVPSFDLCKTNPKYTDRNQTEEDRLLVMEVILCTRKCLYLSFHGQSNKNNNTIPPSIVVEEIIEQLDDLLDFSTEKVIKNAKSAFAVKHPLQAFSKQLFKVSDKHESRGLFFSPEGCRSFSNTSYKGAVALSGEPKLIEEFCSGPISNENPAHPKIHILDLTRFWRNPSSYFLNGSLQVSTKEVSVLLPENERLDSCQWQDSSIKRLLIDQFLDGQDLANSYQELQKQNLLPPGQIGKALHSSMIGELAMMFQRTLPNLAERIPKTTVHGLLNGIEITGETGPFFGSTFFLFHSAKLKGKNCLESLILHLFHNLFGPFPGNSKTVIGAIDKSFRFAPVSPDRAEQILSQLYELYLEGVARPLPFFPNASLAWLVQKIKHEKGKKRKNSLEPLDCAKKSWFNEMGGEGTQFSTELIYQKNPWGLPETLELNELVMGFIDELGEFIL